MRMKCRIWIFQEVMENWLDSEWNIGMTQVEEIVADKLISVFIHCIVRISFHIKIDQPILDIHKNNFIFT